MLETFQFPEFFIKPEVKSPVWFRKAKKIIFEYFNEHERRDWNSINIDNIDFNELKKKFSLYVLNSIKNNFNHAKYPETTKLMEQAFALYKGPATSFDFKRLSEKCFLKSSHIEDETVKEILLTIHLILSDYFGVAILHAVKTYGKNRSHHLSLINEYYNKFLRILYEYSNELN